MSVLSSYRLMGRFRHLRRVRGRVTRYGILVKGSVFLLMIPLVPICILSAILGYICKGLDAVSAAGVRLAEHFLEKPYEKRMQPFVGNAVHYMRRIDGPEFVITTKKPGLEN